MSRKSLEQGVIRNVRAKTVASCKASRGLESKLPALESFLGGLSRRSLRTSRLQVFPARSKQKLLTAKIAKGAEDHKERRLSREFFDAP